MMTQEQIDSIRERMCEEYCGVIGNNNLSIYVRKEACDNCPLNELEASADPWSAIKAILNELERKQEKLYADYCDATARLKAVDKIAKSSQKPNQKIDGIKPLAEMEVTE